MTTKEAIAATGYTEVMMRELAYTLAAETYKGLAEDAIKAYDCQASGKHLKLLADAFAAMLNDTIEEKLNTYTPRHGRAAS